MGENWVYHFNSANVEGGVDLADLLGEKGATLKEMTNLGLAVPPGFTITTGVWAHFVANNRTYPLDLKDQVATALAAVEQTIGARFGDPRNPLLVSIRSGTRTSMPGMMDTVLNLGLNDQTVGGLAAISGDERFAWDSYRRFLQMYGEVVLDIDHHHFEDIIDDHKIDVGATLDTDLTAQDWQVIAAGFQDIVESETGQKFPQDVEAQLWGAIGAVFGSWMNQRAVTYRRLNGIPEDWGTAVSVQAMVFGNRGDDCATGVAFTRNPSTGANELYGEFLVNSQGEDVVAGIRTPQSLTIAGKKATGSALPAMEEVMPEVFGELLKVRKTLEDRYRDMQDIEFTVERGQLWILQTRTGKRTTQAAVKIAVSLVEEGLIDRKEALQRIDTGSIPGLLRPTADPAATNELLFRGLPASPGVACGAVAFSVQDAQILAQQGKSAILMRVEASPEDLAGMFAATGIITTRGGTTSHASVISRSLNKPCIAGAGGIKIDYGAQRFSISNRVINAGEIISINGSTGEGFLEGLSRCPRDVHI
jgi:pyruvate,orthophosphate dikinase